jgi:heme oxygenase
MADLVNLAGQDWRTDLPQLGAATRYANRIATVVAHDPDLLLAHAYVRYLGDLSGGQILKRLLARTLRLDETMLAFHTFPLVPDLERFRPTYLAAFDAAGAGVADLDEVASEAALAFQLNIDLSEAVHQTRLS